MDGTVGNSFQRYVRLLDLVVSREIAVQHFERDFLSIYKADRTYWGSPEFDVLQDIFFLVDEYFPGNAEEEIQMAETSFLISAESLRQRAHGLLSGDSRIDPKD